MSASPPPARRAPRDASSGAPSAAARSPGVRRLVEACARPGCPVCRCVQDAAAGHLRALLDEHVTDPASRARLTEAWGVCATHAAALRRLPEVGLGVAIVYEGLLARAGAWVDACCRAGGAGRRGWRALLRAPAASGVRRLPRARCHVCAELARTERRLLETLVASAGEGELGAALGRSTGPCLPHLELAVALAEDGGAVDRLLAVVRPRLERLREELRAFIAKHDHRARAPFTEAEAQAWPTALELVAGAAEVFGDQLERPAAGGRNRRRAGGLP